MRRLTFLLVGFVLAGAFYLLLVDTTSLPELYVLGGVGLLGGVAFEASREEGFPEGRFSALWFRRAWRAFARVPLDMGLVCVEALAQLFTRRRVRGNFRAVPFKGGDDPEARGRFALTDILGSLAPNTIVIGIDPDKELLLVHQLRPRGGREDIDMLDLG
jgi:multisubunit Na+/H+ antiporter MnhE subunit